MPTGGKGGGTTATKSSTRSTAHNQRAMAQVRAKAAASRQQATRTQVGAQQREYGPKPSRAQQAVQAYEHTQQPSQHELHLHEMGALPVGGLFSLGDKTLSDLGEAAYYTPGGLVALGKGVGKDVGAVGHGDLSFKRTRAMGEAVGKQTLTSFEHPLSHPGYTLLNALAVLSAGAGAASRIGAAGSALRSGEGVAAALARPGFKGGSLLHKPIAREIPLPGGAQALQPDNPLLRPLHRARMNRITRQIETGASSRLPRVIQRHVSAEHVVGRELRAREVIQSDIAKAPIEAARVRLKKLTPAEHTAMRVLAIEGKHALKNPAEAIQRHIQTHLGYAKQGIEPKLNQEIAKDLAKAQSVLEAKPQHFLEAAAAARRVGRVSERQLIGEGRLEKGAAQQRLAKIAAEYGRKPGTAPPGSFYFPTGERFKLPTRTPRGGPVSRKPSEFGVAPVKPSSYLMGTTRQFTGRGLRKGVVQRPGEAIAARASGTARLASAERYQESLKKLATPEKQSEFQVEIRKGPITHEQRMRVAAALEQAQTGDQTALVRAHKEITDALAPAAGEPGVWVDRRYIKEFVSPGGSRLARAAATFNKPFRFGGVYLRPAYVTTNRPQNFLMRKLEQGALTKKQLPGPVRKIRQTLGPELSAKIEASSGETRTASYNPQAGRLGRSERYITEKIMHATDSSERFLAVMHRAWERGYRSPEDLARLYAENAPANVVNDRIAIARRARKDLVDFSSITPAERELADVIYFYPWLSRATAWSGRFVAQHPIKSAALASTAPTGKKEQLGALGPVPGWMKGFISTRFGLSNPASVNTFETPAQIGQTLVHPSGPQARSFGEEFGTPIVQSFTTNPSQLPQRAQQSLAPGLLLQRLGLLGKPPKTFPETGPAAAAGPFMLGGLYPRKPNLKSIRNQAYKEGLVSPVAHAYQQVFARRDHYYVEMKRLGMLDNGRMPKQLRDAFNFEAERQAAYAHAVDVAKAKPGTPEYHYARLSADVHFLEKYQQLPPGEGAQITIWATANRTDIDKLKEARAWLGRHYYQGPDGFLTLISDSRKYLKQKGAKGLR